MTKRLTHLQKSQIAAARRHMDDAKTIFAIALHQQIEAGADEAQVLEAAGWSRATYYRHRPKQLELALKLHP